MIYYINYSLLKHIYIYILYNDKTLYLNVKLFRHKIFILFMIKLITNNT